MSFQIENIMFGRKAKATAPVSCGAGLEWILRDGILTIAGCGEMNNFDQDSKHNRILTPWEEQAEEITAVVIMDGVTSIGGHAFERTVVAKASIPDSVAVIGEYAFFTCSMKEITIPANVKVIGKWAFAMCEELTDIYYKGSEEEWNAIRMDDQNDMLSHVSIHFLG